MELEGLKVEAAKLGYRLVKKQPYIKLLPCTCGEKKPHEWYRAGENGGIFYKCDSCELSASPAKTNKRARENWNNLVSEYVEVK